MNRKQIIKYFALTIVIISLLALAIVVSRGMEGKVVTTGQNPSQVRRESLACICASAYPFFSYDSSKSKELKINIDSYDGSIKSIFLSYELYYDDERSVAASEAANHAAMNVSYGKDGLSADAFNANYTKLSNSMRMTLYTEPDQLDGNFTKYFMLMTGETNDLPHTLNDYKKIYESQGFRCKVGNN